MNKLNIPEGLLTTNQLAIFLNIHPWTIRYWVKNEKIKYFQLGRVVRFDRNEVLRSLEQNANKAPDKYSSLKNRLGQKHQLKRGV